MTGIQMIETLGTLFAEIPANSKIMSGAMPIPMAWLGGLMVVIFSFSFVRVIQVKIEDWNREKLSPLPLEDFYSITSWFGALSGLSIMFTGVLQVFNFSLLNSLIASIILALITGIPMWGVVRQLLIEIESGTIKEIDQFF